MLFFLHILTKDNVSKIIPSQYLNKLFTAINVFKRLLIKLQLFLRSLYDRTNL